MNTFGKGALAPKADVRDYKVAAAAAEYPKAWQVDYLPPVKNQKSVGSCVAHATSSILEYFDYKETGEKTNLSTDFIYGMQGVAFGRMDSGMYLRDACKIVKQYGDCLKETISTNTEQPKCTENLKEIIEKAPVLLEKDIYKEAEQYQVKSYAKCTTDSAIKHALMNYGPVLGSVRWYDKNTVKGEVVEMDKTSSWGGHAIMIYGWNEIGWLCQNSWGKGWNGDGRFTVPYGEIKEAWSFVDAENDENIVQPIRGNWIDKIYKLVNLIINFFKNKK